MKYLINRKHVKFIFQLILISLLLNGCNDKNNKPLFIEAEVYYQMLDNLLGTRADKRRILLRIPVAITDTKIVNGSNLILCMKKSDNIVHFSHLFDGKRNNAELLLKATVINEYKGDTLVVEPEFSPISVSKDSYKKLGYEKGKTKIIYIRIEADNKNFIEYDNAAKLTMIRNREPERYK